MRLLSIIIKTYNEEANVARAIESALAATAALDAEIVVADCLSTDRTVAIASAYPVTIVQLEAPAKRSCGISPQLGYQHSTGAFLYLVDGDMVLNRAFVTAALDLLAREPGVAGVGGLIREMNVGNLEFANRVRRVKRDLEPGTVDRLNGGGIFRRAAIEAAGFFSDRNLHAYEELELAMRLRQGGWQLVRLNLVAVEHYGHTVDAYRLLWRRFRTGYALGVGELLRAGLARSSLRRVAAEVPELKIYAATMAWWAALALLLSVPRPGAALALFVLPFAIMALKRRSLRLGIYAVVAWNANAVGALLGLMRPRQDPTARVESRVIQTAPTEPAVMSRRDDAPRSAAI